MSINLENPKTLLGKVDAAANLVEQMGLAHQMHDNAHFSKVKQQTARLLSEATTMAEALNEDIDQD